MAPVKKVAGRSDTAVFPRFKGQRRQAQFICMNVDVCYSCLLTLPSTKYRHSLPCVRLAGGGKYLQAGLVMGTRESHGRDSDGDMVPTATAKAT